MFTILKLVRKGILNDDIYVFMVVLGTANMICSILSLFREVGIEFFFTNTNNLLFVILGGFFFPIIIMGLVFDGIALILHVLKN